MADFGLNHIPFGLRENDKAIVDVYEVKRGRECGCICPSCRTPLIARQGEEKVWHFAHASEKWASTSWPERRGLLPAPQGLRGLRVRGMGRSG